MTAEELWGVDWTLDQVIEGDMVFDLKQNSYGCRRRSPVPKVNPNMVHAPLIRQNHTFTIQGHTVEAPSRKEAIAKLRWQGEDW